MPHGEHAHGHGSPGPGHNGGPAALQWQRPHLPPGAPQTTEPAPERDLDLVEASFVEEFSTCSDPTSFLLLAGIPFTGTDAEGRRLRLLRVELECVTDVGAVVPLLGGEGLRCDPLPGRLVSRRRRLQFVYHDGERLIRIDFAHARGLVVVG